MDTINHLISPQPGPLMSAVFMLNRNFQLNFRVTVWKLIPASRLYVIHHQNLIKIANKNVMQLSASVSQSVSSGAN